MANQLYDTAREQFLAGTLSWSNDTIKATLVTTDYTFSVAHTSLASINASYCLATSAALTAKTVTNGIANAANSVFTAVPTNAKQGNAIIIFKDTGTASTSTLIVYIDTGTGLPVTTNGGDININWATGASKIFKL